LIYRKTAAVLLYFAAVSAVPAESPKLSADQASILEDARAYALQYSEQLPNFICTQVTRREISRNNHFAMMATTESVNHDLIEEQLTFLNGRESYKVLSLNGKAATGLVHLQIGGAISTGEFGTIFSQVFANDSHTIFTWDRETSTRGHRVLAFKFHVPREAGATVIDRESNTAMVAPFSGRVLIDPETFAVLEISSTLELPASFRIRNVERKILYAEQDIAGKSYNLPIHCEIHMQEGNLVFDNSIDFKDYHRFTSESTIHVGDSVQQ
jgi:hypothetical protein